MNNEGQFEFEFSNFNLNSFGDDETAIQASLLADANANAHLVNAITDTPYAGCSEQSRGIHNNPSESGDAVPGPSKSFNGIHIHPSEAGDAVPGPETPYAGPSDEGFVPFNGIHNVSDAAESVAGPSKGPHRLDTIQDFLCKLDMKPHLHSV